MRSSLTEHVRKFMEEGEDCIGSERVASSDERDGLKRDYQAAIEELDTLERLLERTVWIAEHLFQMIDRATWRSTGGDDGQGRYEGDYRAEQMDQELRGLREMVGPHEYSG